MSYSTVRNFMHLEYIGSLAHIKKPHQVIDLYHINVCKYAQLCVQNNETPNTFLITISIVNFR